MMSLNTTVSLSLIFSLIAMCANIFAILGVSRSHIKENQEKDINIEKNFLKVNMKLDEFCRDLSDLVKKTDTSATQLIEMQKTLVSINNAIESHEKSLNDHEERLTNIEKSLIESRR